MHYASEVLDRALGIEYVDVDETVRREIQSTVQRIADLLGREPPPVTVPDRGLLSHKLTPNQRGVLNAVLGPEYAQGNTQHQELLRSVPIVECGERLSALRSAIEARQARALFSDLPFHEACASWAGQQRVFFLRKEVTEKIAEVAVALNRVGFMPQIEDCWRHYLVQRGLLVRRIIGIARDYGDWDWRKVVETAGSFTAPAPGLAGHQAGAAVDLRLCDLNTRTLLDLGNEYPESGAASSIDFPYLTQDQWRTRTIFQATMHSAGLKILRTEDWHGSHGDRGMGIDGRVWMSQAHYGPIVDFDRATGAITPYPQNLVEGLYLNEDQAERLVARARDHNTDGVFTAQDADLFRQFNPAEGFIEQT
jgi:D-alanyl-D-alanine dipeptidase